MKLKNALKPRILMLPLLISITFAGMDLSEPVFIPWGEGPREVRHVAYPGLHGGPLSFQIQNDEIIIYDTENRQLKTFGSEGLRRTMLLDEPRILDFYVRDERTLYLQSDRQLFRRENGETRLLSGIEDPKGMFLGLRSDKGRIIARTAEGGIDCETPRLDKPAGISVPRVTRRLPDRVQVRFGERTVSLTVPDVGSVDYLGSTPDGLHYIYAESILRHVPVAVDRYVYLIDEQARTHAAIRLPRQQFTYVFKEFIVDEAGAFWHMQSSQDGIHIIRWAYDGTASQEVQTYPDTFSEICHFNGYSAPEPAIANPPLNKSAAASVTAVTRAEALAIANDHVVHVWTATAANIGTTATVTTPAWIQVGQNVSIPYKWGGWNTIAQFDAGIAAGKLAGDINTQVVDWGNSVGNDCSGYVSICWKTAQKYGTSTISSVSYQLPSVNDLLPGDATNKSGSHIRLFVEWTDDGKLIQAEATSSGIPGWFTRYYTWTVSGITGYVPIRYNSMVGAQGPRPTLLFAVAEGDSVDLAWTADESVDFTGYRISRKLCGEDAFTPVQNIPKGTLSARIAQPATTHYDYRISSYIQSENTSEPVSDVYSVKHLSADKQILIVDGFDRFSGTGSYAYPTHDFVAQNAKALDCRNVAYESCANEAVIDGRVDLKDYDLVWWILGDESTEDETFNDIEQDSVESYLDRGGKFFVSGSEIGWDLDNRGTVADKAFFNTYLKAAYAADDAANYSVLGAAGTVFEGLQYAYSETGSQAGTFPEDYPDVLSASGGSVTAMKYGNDLRAALIYEGNAPGGSVPGKVMVMGFPFETITTEYSKTEVAGFILRFMGYEVELAARDLAPNSFELYANYPNPFNPRTTLAYRLETPAYVELDIFNIRGEFVERIVARNQDPGRHEIVFDGTNRPAGMYVYRLNTDHRVRTVGKMTLLK
ncbi:MAG: T9SS type A sorting domain-containing protein [Candidatus Marinimicrobia bacterium]|nr:T9SS type A sorting domain-containing protein [Candidatus Neomarinimicrobiota bacterium]